MSHCKACDKMMSDKEMLTLDTLSGEHSELCAKCLALSLIHISEPTRQATISYAVFCL